MLNEDSLANCLSHFLDRSPTAYHAVDSAKKELENNGFTFCPVEEPLKWTAESKGFTVLNGTALCAWICPKKTTHNLLVAASHTDSPGLKIKPRSQFQKANETGLSVEIYGGPLLSSWLNRDLGIAGKVYYRDKKGHLAHELVQLDEMPLIIPQLAIHLDRQVNEQGLVLNKQEHLNPLCGIDLPYEENFLENLIQTRFSFQKVLAHDLFLYPLEKAARIGYHNQLIASYRIDSLCSVQSILAAFLETQADAHTLKMIVFWNHEEVGSSTAEGASSPFFLNTLERLLLSARMPREEFLRLVQGGTCLSVDLAHGLSLNHVEKLDSNHAPLLGKGVVIKTNAQKRYASDARSIAFLTNICEQKSIPYQFFASRGDIPCGSTIGPLHATQTGMQTVDLGIAQLSMHSAREIASLKDHFAMYQLLKEAFSLTT